MIIGIDASRANSREKTGTENYSYNLISALAKIDQKNTYRLYLRPDYDRSLEALPKNFHLKEIKISRFWTQIGLSWEMLINKPDVLFVPAHTMPFFAPKKTILTVHDLAWRYFPEAYSKADLFLHKQSIKRALAKKATIIVYSKSTYNDLKNNFKINPNLVRFTPMGFTAPKPEGEEDEFKKFQPYILAVGRLEKRKNTLNIVKSYTLLRKERRIKHKLLLAGKPGFGYEEIREEIEKSGKIRDDIVELGFVDDKKLPALYKDASILLYPSIYEGFGYPILEAYSQDTPVITSNVSSMPEVADGAAMLVNPNKVFEITAAMSQIINKPRIADGLRKRGEKVISRYSWEECAQETLNVILEIR